MNGAWVRLSGSEGGMAGLPAVPAASPAPAPAPAPAPPLAAAAPPEPEPEPGRWSFAVVLATAMLHRPPSGRARGAGWTGVDGSGPDDPQPSCYAVATGGIRQFGLIGPVSMGKHRAPRGARKRVPASQRGASASGLRSDGGATREDADSGRPGGEQGD